MASIALDAPADLTPAEHQAERMCWQPPFVEVVHSSASLRQLMVIGEVKLVLGHMRLHGLPVRYLFGQYPERRVDRITGSAGQGRTDRSCSPSAPHWPRR